MKFGVMTAFLVFGGCAGIWAVDPAPEPVGITLGAEFSLTGITSVKDPANGAAYKPTLGAGYTVDYFHSIENFDFEFFLQRAMEISPITITNPGGWYQQNAAGLLYLEGDLYYNFKLKGLTVTPGMSFQDWAWNPFAKSSIFQFEPSVKFDLGNVNFKLADNLAPQADNSIINNPYVQVGVKFGDFSAYIKPDFLFTNFRLNGFKWYISKGLNETFSLYTYGILTGDATIGFAGDTYYNQFLGIALTF